MKSVFLVILILAGVNLVATAQTIAINEDSLSTEQYAGKVAIIYERALNLDGKQLKQTYIAILSKKKTLDSLRKNNVQIDRDKIWTINISLDEMFKRILTSHQYLDYLDFQSKQIFTVKVSQK